MLIKTVVALAYTLVIIAFVNSYCRYLKFYEENRLSEDGWGNSPQIAQYGSGDQIYERVQVDVFNRGDPTALR